MPDLVTLTYDQGYVSRRHGRMLNPGELQAMKGYYYKAGDRERIWKRLGRTLFGATGVTGAVKGLALAKFDTGGLDKLLAYVGTVIYSALPGLTGTFTSLITGLNAAATNFSVCHAEDRQYICNGYDRNRVLMSDGTTRFHGMLQPIQAPAVARSGVAVVGDVVPTADSGGYANGDRARDTDDGTFAVGTVSTVTSVTHTWTWPVATDAGKTLGVRHQITFGDAPLPYNFFTRNADSFGIGARTRAASKARVLIEKSENGGTSFSSIYDTTRNYGNGDAIVQGMQVTLGAGAITLHLRCTVTLIGGSGVTVSHAVFTVKTVTAPSLANFNTTTGLRYAVAEYDASNDLSSAPGPITQNVTLATQNRVTLTFPAAVNANATHWLVYRNTDGAAANWSTLGQLPDGVVPIAQTTYNDNFGLDKDTQPRPTVPVLVVSSNDPAGGDEFFLRDLPPPPFKNLTYYKGCLCGLSRTDPRTWFPSMAGFPESFPAIDPIASFPLPEHDELVGQMVVGESLLLLAQEAIIILTDVPNVTEGVFNKTEAIPFRGQPGCVGPEAYTVYSVGGEARGAWISPFGVHETNGSVARRITEDLDWASEVNPATLLSAVLRWDTNEQILWMEHDSDGDGVNDRETPIHMAESHRKDSGQPKIGQPTPKATASLAHGMVASVYRRFSGHTSDGNVYVEEQDSLDAATGNGITSQVKHRKVYGPRQEFAVMKAVLAHTNWGTGVVGTLTTLTGRDSSDSTQTRSDSVSLNGDKDTEQTILRAGQWVEFTLDETGGSGALLNLQLEVQKQGPTGTTSRL